MEKLFIIQLITSFFVGGAFIALLVTLAERTSKQLAGVIIIFPSTIALSFFFLAWVLSPEAVAHVAPVAILSTAINFILFLIYPYVANFFAGKIKNKILKFHINYLPRS